MGNCILKVVADVAHELESIKITPYSDQLRIDGSRKSVKVLPPKDGVWRVKLVIDPKDLEEIMSKQVNIEALIEQMRVAAISTPRREKGSRWGF